MGARLASWIWVDALKARVEAAGAGFAVERRGDASAGDIIIKLLRADGGFGGPSEARALIRDRDLEGAPVWRWFKGDAWIEESVLSESVAKRVAIDPDLWILTIEDRDNRHFLEEPIQ